MQINEKAKAWADKEYDELRYSKCEKKHFVFTFRELREMGKQAFIAGYDAASEELEKEYADLPAIAYQQGAEAYKKKSDAKLEKARALLAQWAQTSLAGACDNVNLAAETDQYLAGEK